MDARTVVVDVADMLARRVVTGEYAPTTLMPSVRQVAEEFEINRATAQLVLGRLESQGFVDAKRAKGFVVRDVRVDGGMEVYCRLFQLSVTASPGIASEMFEEMVESQRQILADAFLAYTAMCDEGSLRQGDLHDDVDRLEALARAEEPDHVAILSLELALIRRIMGTTGQAFQRATLNSIGATILSVPEAVAAYFAVSPDLHVLMWRAMAAVWDSGSAPSDAQLALFDDLLGLYHQRVLSKFDEIVLPAEQVDEEVAIDFATA
ncbi:putative GntR family transcriptional regulator [Gordonia effusa NBRC 100432]|uniref:Putative GntR family transcriptional regulator n=1 Tax=Gordonia effusa NBRC 100432 TaxID=1077974 RepID=H0R4Y7_9ACTN|nr:winged helix-turn-helix domain-containing protein [Gordonia effusa]GAB20138.1 putative GntR family transcriptional regulator [Gordonia effusa NBRC 100432]